MTQMLSGPYVWLILAFIFNIGHMFFHVAFFRGYKSKYSTIYDGIVGYLGALFVIILVYMDRGTVQFPKMIAIPIGLILFVTICGYLEEVKLRKDLPNGQYNDYAKNTWI